MTSNARVKFNLFRSLEAEVVSTRETRKNLSYRAIALPILLCLPYAAVSIGSNTNLPLASIFGVLFLKEFLASTKLAIGFLITLLLPTFVLLVHTLTGADILAPRSLVTWIVAVTPFFAMASAVSRWPYAVLLGTRAGVALSAVYVLIQGTFINAGVLPFSYLYRAAGYASVADHTDEIVEYIKRPFGWFPEPSFMAGSLVLGICTTLLLLYFSGRGPTALDYAIVALTFVAILWAQSGSALFALPAILILLLFPGRSLVARSLIVVAAVPGTLYALAEVVYSRSSSTNYSWTDRYNSIVAAFQLVFSNPEFFLFGTSRGALSEMFASGLVPTSRLQTSAPIADIFSVLGRIIVENGMIGGLPLVLIGCLLVFRAYKKFVGVLYAYLALFTWLVVGGITITYDTASWIYAFPGVAIGVCLAKGRFDLAKRPMNMER